MTARNIGVAAAYGDGDEWVGAMAHPGDLVREAAGLPTR